MKLFLLGLLALSLGVGIGVWLASDRFRAETHEKFCAKVEAGYLESIQRHRQIVLGKPGWINGVNTGRKLVNLCNSGLNYPDLSKYEIPRLAERKDWGGKIELGEIESEEDGVEARKFYFMSDGKRISGFAHIPVGCKKCPVIAQFRGYYDAGRYFPGAGTRKTAQWFARAGFVSLAPDFLGYGESDARAENVFEARFESYIAAVNLLKSVGSLDFVDEEKIGIWGHSNGGQVALTALEITGGEYPTVLWAPVTAPFPYSVLYYTDGYDDGGKALRKDLAVFEADFDADKFSLANYLDRIKAPIVLHQGTADLDVPLKWSRGTVGELRKLGKKVEYKEHFGADHNMRPIWDEVMRQDIEFFKSQW